MGFETTLINRIIDLEWAMFQQVKGLGGPAACQQDRPTFEVMRRGQAMSWSVQTLESYQADLEAAQTAGRNLITEKYARMMASTAPDEYAKMGPLLPLVSPEAIALIDSITEIVLDWEQTLEVDYPQLFKRGRPLLSSADRPGATSVETYLRGELATYSLRTLQCYHAHIKQQKAAGTNGARMTLEYMVARSGYPSLAVAELAMGSSGRRDGPGSDMKM